jgi:hypothetical protein
LFAALGVGAVASALAMLPILPSTSHAADATISGFDLSGFASPISLYLFEPEIPIPTTPQGEIDYSYTAATMQSGPFATAVSSSVYPGATLATGLPQFAPPVPAPFNKLLTPPPYPVYETASYPGSPSETHAEKTVPNTGIGMTADASETKAVGSAQSGKSFQPSIMDFANAASTTTAQQAANKVTMTSDATASDITFLGLIHLDGVHSVATASSTPSKGTPGGGVTVGGVSVLGVPISVTNKGTTVGPASLPKIPGLPSTGNALLQTLGISFAPPTVQPKVSGASVQQAILGVQVSVNLTKYTSAIRTLPIETLINLLIPQSVQDQLCVPQTLHGNPFGNQLPFGACLSQNIDAFINLSPTLVATFGNNIAASNASKPFVFNPGLFGNTGGPTTTTTAGTVGTPGTAGTPGLNPGSTGVPAPQVAGPSTSVAKQFPAGYGGLRGALLLGALVALATWYAVRNLGLGVVGGFAGCEYGAPRAVPDLRRG